MKLLKRKQAVAAVAAMLAMVTASAGSAHAALNPNSDTQVNATVIGDQRAPAVARNANGDSIVVWQGPDADGIGIFAQHYDDSGNPVGAQIAVNTTTAGDQVLPDVGLDAAGNFTVVWQGPETGAGSGTTGIFGRRFDTAGTPLDSDIAINTFAPGNQSFPAISMNENGEFAITWQSTQQADATLGDDIYARRYAPSGSASAEFLVNTTTVGDQQRPDVVIDDQQNFAIVWQSAGQDGDGLGVYARVFYSNGAAQSEFQVNQFTAGDQGSPAVTAGINNTLIFAWESNGQDGSGYGIYAKAFTYDQQGFSEFRVNFDTTVGDQRFPTISAGANPLLNRHDIVIAWQTPDGSGTGVVAKTFRANGPSRELLINRFRAGDQGLPAVALDTSGNYVIVWESQNQDGSGYGIYGGLLPINNAPTTKNATVGLNEDMAFNGQLSARDEDGDFPRFSIVDGPANGTLNLNEQTGAYTYTPNNNYNGKDSFTFTATDGLLTSNTSIVRLNIRGVNDAPVAQDQSVTVTQDRPKYITLKGTDVDNSALTYSIVTQPTNGTLTGKANSYKYTPNAGSTGLDSFTFKVNDGSLDSNTVGTVSIDVQP